MTNDATRANGTALPEISRRNFLLHTAAVGAVMAIATPAIASAHPDAALFKLEKEMKVVHARMKRAYRRCSQIAEEVRKAVGARPPHPAKWREPNMPDDVSDAFDRMTLGEVRERKYPAPYKAWRDAMKEAEASVAATWDEFAKVQKQQYRLHGYDAAETAADALSDDLWDIGRRIFAMPASTFEGLMVKVRAGKRLGLGDYDDVDESFLSIAKDIKRLSKGGAA